jgi:hypothetical protein
MRIGPAPRILIVAGICAASLIGLVISEGMARNAGTEILLPIEAVDPRALLSGHYVIVAPTQRLEPGEQCPPGEETRKWIAFRAQGDIHVVAGGAGSREDAQLIAPLVARGEFYCNPPTPESDGNPAQPGWVRATLGIERFYINQGEAERIDRVLRDQQPGEEARVFAIVSVGGDGRARLRGLKIDDQRLELDWL